MANKGEPIATLKADRRLLILENALKTHKYQKDSLLEILHTPQESYGFLDKDMMIYIADALKLPTSHVFGVATLYNFFKLKKPGMHVITFCLGTACYVKGSEDILKKVETEFLVKRGESTVDGKLSVFTTRCIGACAMAPNVIIDENVVGKATSESVIKRVKGVKGG
jgi:bidirectional [NiFe] hydrogenase diaphorase subunit